MDTTDFWLNKKNKKKTKPIIYPTAQYVQS